MKLSRPQSNFFGKGKMLEKIKWSIRRRLERLELLLYWNGSANRADLTNFFKISEPQATADLNLYKEYAPKNVSYDLSQKTYLATEGFEPVFVKPKAAIYFNQLRLFQAGLIEKSEAWVRSPPDFDSIPLGIKVCEAEILRLALEGIRSKKILKIDYQSMSNPTISRREIGPHALGFNGKRWHLRSYCFNHDDFRDFSFSRIKNIKVLGDSGINKQNDKDWSTFIDVILIANPELSKDQQKAISREYGMKAGRLKKRVRKAMLFYFADHHRLDPKKFNLKPWEKHLVAENWKELKREIP